MNPPAQFHHRSTTKVSQKPFKSKHASKNKIRDLLKGRVEGKGIKKPLSQQGMSKADRRHKARQLAQAKHKAHAEATKLFSGRNGAPRIVSIVPLSRSVKPGEAVLSLVGSVDAESITSTWSSKSRVDRFKQSIQYLTPDYSLFGILDACRLADYVLLLFSADEEVDDYGELIIRSVEGQGVSNVLSAVQGLDEQPKKRQQTLSSLKSYVTHFFPLQEKIHALDNRQECANVVRSLCTSTPKGIRWREDRSWMLADEIEWIDDGGRVAISGVVRGRGLNPNRLLHVGDWGDFQIEKIVAESEVLPDTDQDDTAEFAPEELEMDDGPGEDEPKGVLLDEHHYFSDDESHLPAAPKRVPKGTSNYQSAWYLGDESDSGSDYEEDIVMDVASEAGPADGIEKGSEKPEPTDAASEYASEMFLDKAPDEEAEEIAAYRSRRKAEAQEDLEFPDEIELHPNVLARERLARYRGLKNLRTSTWSTREDRPHRPAEWNRLLQVPDYKASRSKVTREALVGGVTPGSRVQIQIKGVPLSLKEHINSKPLVPVFSLLRHEHKKTATNITMTLNSDHSGPVKSKEELILQCGPHRLVVNPLFSAAGTTPNDVHKYDRYIHPGRTSMATFIGPMIWGAVPALFYKKKGSTVELIGRGTVCPPSSSRVVAKRIILTGHPYKIHKKLVTIRYMFFNAEDVAWFKALQLWTKRGRSGFIKESLGTHGYFKATFDAKINPQDSVGVSLYKRVWPRNSQPVDVKELEALGEHKDEDAMMT